MARDPGHPRLAQASLHARSDEQLAALAGAGSEAAFEVIVTRHRRALVRHCAGLVGEGDAEEAVQEALLKAHGALGHGHAVHALAPWLHKIAHNTALSMLRSRAARPTIAESDCECAHRTDEASLRREDFREVIDAIAALPPRQRDALVMHELDDRSYAEIATRLGASSAAVRQLLNRARGSSRREP
jgi:RNA polymerase sigma-70 factor (ECF subfamily)